MVSQLSLRLMGGSSCSASAMNSSRDSKSATRSSTNASTHGYSGDNEEFSNKGESNEQVPSKIDMGNGPSNKKRYTPIIHSPCPTGKKQKVMLRNYAAHTAKQDMRQGNLPYKKLCGDMPCLLSEAGKTVDLSQVTLIRAYDVKESPFLLPTKYSSPFETDYWHTMMSSLLTSTSRVYEKSGSSAADVSLNTRSIRPDQGNECNSPSEDAYNSASSISDSEEGGDGSIQDGGDDMAAATKSANGNKTSVVNLGSALALSNQARVVVLGFAPYSVVHVNAAYSRMTGIPSTTALGQPLHEIFFDDAAAATLHSKDNNFTLSSLHLQAIKMNSAKDMPKCVVRVSPVGSDGASVTHFVLEIETEIEVQGQPVMVHQNYNGSIGVMG
ncbi:hypothetical protein MPSEU_000519700 [Mayamaea pseudoterrestris]|nr:hypothetical protein MPSEU_000519700 [Mayamaea pseudoterrestris]